MQIIECTRQVAYEDWHAFLRLSGFISFFEKGLAFGTKGEKVKLRQNLLGIVIKKEKKISPTQTKKQRLWNLFYEYPYNSSYKVESNCFYFFASLNKSWCEISLWY